MRGRDGLGQQELGAGALRWLAEPAMPGAGWLAGRPASWACTLHCTLLPYRSQVAMDPESGQTIVSGMGELHLEIYIERMKREYKVPTRGEGGTARRCTAGYVPPCYVTQLVQ